MRGLLSLGAGHALAVGTVRINKNKRARPYGAAAGAAGAVVAAAGAPGALGLPSAMDSDASVVRGLRQWPSARMESAPHGARGSSRA